MVTSTSDLHNTLILLSQPIREILSKTSYKPPDSTNVSIKSLLETLLPPININKQFELQSVLTNFTLLCAALSTSQTSTYDQLSWIPVSLSNAADAAFRELRKAFVDNEDKDLVVELLPRVFPLLKLSIKESSIDKEDEVSAASARVPVAYAIVAAYQFKWFVTQVDLSQLAKLCSLIIPCALTALDHWSPELNNLQYTVAGDMGELNALKKTFKKTTRIKMNATKSMIGHAAGAAGSLEAIAIVKAIQTGWLHPTINQFDLEPALQIDTVANQKKQHEIDVAISNSFGLGGHNSVVAFSAFKP